MKILERVRGLFMQMIGQPDKEKEKRIDEQIMKRRAKAYEELAKY